ncbi:uncharacterized protein C8Q71DRAFT_728504 [Rhodofomes roseus]|uniref:Uncharacterized protein n=1 Tax=Rhodofomes roseus TaxID=34475 RepID=A0ABQ8JYC9_9APHY|nr:uncharacterized protein C8Q71DRAFT_728504 [Rhodofomes roseus]KAH9828670.1 hypothetical protein C8Q71DRAFT_728504 [Rhodofomes roseus]
MAGSSKNSEPCSNKASNLCSSGSGECNKQCSTICDSPASESFHKCSVCNRSVYDDSVYNLSVYDCFVYNLSVYDCFVYGRSASDDCFVYDCYWRHLQMRSSLTSSETDKHQQLLSESLQLLRRRADTLPSSCRISVDPHGPLLLSSHSHVIQLLMHHSITRLTPADLPSGAAASQALEVSKNDLCVEVFDPVHARWVITTVTDNLSSELGGQKPELLIRAWAPGHELADSACPSLDDHLDRLYGIQHTAPESDLTGLDVTTSELLPTSPAALEPANDPATAEPANDPAPAIQGQPNPSFPSGFFFCDLYLGAERIQQLNDTGMKTADAFMKVFPTVGHYAESTWGDVKRRFRQGTAEECTEWISKGRTPGAAFTHFRHLVKTRQHSRALPFDRKPPRRGRTAPPVAPSAPMVVLEHEELRAGGHSAQPAEIVLQAGQATGSSSSNASTDAELIPEQAVDEPVIDWEPPLPQLLFNLELFQEQAVDEPTNEWGLPLSQIPSDLGITPSATMFNLGATEPSPLSADSELGDKGPLPSAEEIDEFFATFTNP